MCTMTLHANDVINAFSYRTVSNDTISILTILLNIVIEFGTAVYRITEHSLVIWWQ